MVPQTNKSNNLRKAQEDLSMPAVNRFNSRMNITAGNQMNSSSSQVLAKKIKRVDRRAYQEDQTSATDQTKPAVSKIGRNKKKANYRDSMMSLDRQFMDNPLNVARYCQQIFDFYIQQEVYSKEEVHCERLEQR